MYLYVYAGMKLYMDVYIAYVYIHLYLYVSVCILYVYCMYVCWACCYFHCDITVNKMAAEIALGPKFATWTWQGIVEMGAMGPLLFIGHPSMVAPHPGRSHLERVPGRLGRLVLFGLPTSGPP